MFVKITASGSRRYVQLVESYRDDAGRVKKRTVATLGRLDQLGGELDSVINGLLKVSGRQAVSTGATPAITFESARALGDVWTLTELWNSLGSPRVTIVVASIETDNSGANMKDGRGAIRTGIQGSSGGEVAAAAERIGG